MTRQPLIDAVANDSHGTSRKSKLSSILFLGEIGKALRSGERVDLRGFGSFVVKDKASGKGGDPKTGETIQIPAHKSATFKAGKELSSSLLAVQTSSVRHRCSRKGIQRNELRRTL